jgi:pimeloyl-ACP methyl ester carboxylesterase
VWVAGRGHRRRVHRRLDCARPGSATKPARGPGRGAEPLRLRTLGRHPPQLGAGQRPVHRDALAGGRRHHRPYRDEGGAAARARGRAARLWQAATRIGRRTVSVRLAPRPRPGVPLPVPALAQLDCGARALPGDHRAVVLAYGDDDWSRPEEREANLRAIPGARSALLRGCGHFSSLDRPQDVARIIFEGGT